MSEPAAGSDRARRLDFHLPPFMRESWVSDAASRRWSTELRERSQALLELLIDAVAEGLPPVLRRRIPGWQLFVLRSAARRRGLAHRFEVVCDPGDLDPRRPGLLWYDVVVGPAELLAELDNCGPARGAALLGIPDCCAAAATEPRREGWSEPIWQTARATASARVEAEVVTLDGEPVMNPLLWRLGLRVASHLPCSFDCGHSRRALAQLSALAIASARRAQFEGVLELLSWPAEWSALHGLAELRLPVARFVTTCDATATRVAVRWQGSSYPEHGARGIRFPFRQQGSAAVSDSPAFARGLANPIIPASRLRAPVQPSAPLEVLPRYLDPTIDWARLASPQADGYDTELALRLGERERSEAAAEPSLYAGAVAVRDSDPGLLTKLGWSRGPLRHAHIDEAARLLARWPVAQRQFAALMTVFHPVLTADFPSPDTAPARGSSSHHLMRARGHIWATISDPIGLAQAFVHELAHTKLFDLGLAVESEHHLIVNPLDELFDSPIRLDQRRPMSAVVHAQYSFIYVTALDLELLRGELRPDQREHLLALLRRNVARMQTGFALIERHARTDARGREFLDAFMTWSRRVLDGGQSLLS